MADSAAYEIFEVGIQRDKKGKSATRQFLDAWVDFTGGVLGEYEFALLIAWVLYQSAWAELIKIMLAAKNEGQSMTTFRLMQDGIRY